MKRFFNTTGVCHPEKHYMVNPFRDVYDDVQRLIEAEQYFLLHAPRQTGKTIFVHSLAHRLNQEGKYVATVCSLESAGYPSIKVETANEVFIHSLYQITPLFLEEALLPPNPYDYPASAQLFKQYLTDWCKTLDKPLVLLLDEVDALYDDDVLIPTLRQLRDGSLDMDKLLEAFVDFYRRHSESWLERFSYKEAGHQLLLMAFLQRVINGGGRIEREMAIGNGRTDLAVFWKDQVIPVEIKMHYNARSEPEGLWQLARYMDKLGQQRGHLILFEKKSAEGLPREARIRREVHEVDGKEVELWGM